MPIARLEHGRTRVTVAPHAGGRIAQIEIFAGGRWLALLHSDDTEAERDPYGWGSFVMAPWPNRVANGRFAYAGREHSLPRNDGGHALHGLVGERPWAIESRDDTSVTMSIDLGPLWPWSGRCSQQIVLLSDGLRQRIEIEATGAPFPAGAGWHPWFRRDIGAGSPAAVRVDASSRYELGDMIPTGRMVAVHGDFDLRSNVMAGNRRLDDCYRLEGDMSVRWGAFELTLRSSSNVNHAVVFTPAHAVCLEPQTCAIDAFNLEARGIDAGVAEVAPGRPLVAWTEWTWLERA